MNEQSMQTAERILAASQITAVDLAKLEIASGIQLLSRVDPVPGAVSGLLVYDAAAVRKLIEAGLLPQTR